MTQQITDPKGLKDNNPSRVSSENKKEERQVENTGDIEEQVLNEEDQQRSVNPTDTEGDARGVFLDLHAGYGPGDDDDDDDEDEDAGVSDPGTEIDIPFPDTDDDADDTTKKIPSF